MIFAPDLIGKCVANNLPKARRPVSEMKTLDYRGCSIRVVWGFSERKWTNNI